MIKTFRRVVSESGKVEGKKQLTQSEAYDLMKSIINGALKDNDVHNASRRVAQQIVNEVWNSSQPRNEKVFNDTVELLQPCMGAGLMSYFSHIVNKLVSETLAKRKKLIHFRKTKPLRSARRRVRWMLLSVAITR